MKIISCYITGFGRFKNYREDFSDGLNAFLRENGWGKTTLSVFIKAMFFGMEYSRRKALSEREHYAPWAGGPYGGSLIFREGDRTYRIERTFGATNRTDKFKLFDEDTGLESEDYSENIGEELFLVDRQSFEKSIFVPQGALATGMTDSLNAKIGDLATVRDDINNFDDAIKSLKDARTVYTRNSKINPGKLVSLRGEIRACREALEQVIPLAEGYEKQKDILEEKRARLDELTHRKRVIQDSITEQSRREQQLGAFQEKKKVLEDKQQEYEDLKEFFRGGLPTREEIASYDEKERQLTFDITHLDAALAALPEPVERDRLEELFGESEISPEDISRWEDQAQKILTLRVRGEHTRMDSEDKSQLSELDSFFSRHVPQEEELTRAQADAAAYMELSGKVKTLEEQYEKLNGKVESGGNFRGRQAMGGPNPLVLFLILAIVLLGGAIAFFGLDNHGAGRVIGVVCALASAASFVIGLSLSISRLKSASRARSMAESERDIARREIEDRRAERDSYLSSVTGFLADYPLDKDVSCLKQVSEVEQKAGLYMKLTEQEEKKLKDSGEALDELASLQTELYTQLSHFAACYGTDLYESHEESELLTRLAVDLAAYNKMRSDRKVEAELAGHVKSAKAELFGFLSGFPLEDPTSGEKLKDNLLTIRKYLDEYNSADRELKELEGELKEFREEKDIREGTQSVEELQKQLASIDSQISELNPQITKSVDDLAEIADELEQLEERGEELPGLLEREERYKQRVVRYDQTIDFLQQAKENFLSRYLGPLREGLARYMGMIFGPESEADLEAADFTLDMNLNISIIRHGYTREAAYLSEGFFDLASVCARLALIDVLYPREYPVIFLDDPFSNLDQDKAAQALGLLKNISGSRQILYFTCHPSRMPMEA